MAEGRYVISSIGQTLVVTLEGAADAGALLAASEVLAELHARRGADSVVFEVSGCEVIDLDEFTELQKVVRAMEWLGLRCVIAGLSPGIVAYLALGRHLGRIASHIARSRACIIGAQSTP